MTCRSELELKIETGMTISCPFWFFGYHRIDRLVKCFTVSVGRCIAVKIVFVYKAETVDFHLDACFFQDFANDGFLCSFAEFYPAADGV